MIHSRLAMQGIAYTCAPHQVGLLSTSQQPRGVSHVSGKTIHQEPGESQVTPRPTPIQTIAPQVMTSPSPRAASEALATARLYHPPLMFSAGEAGAGVLPGDGGGAPTGCPCGLAGACRTNRKSPPSCPA